MVSKIKCFIYEQKGAETAEWAVVVGLLVIVASASYSSGGLGAAVNTVFTKISNAIAG